MTNTTLTSSKEAATTSNAASHSLISEGSLTANNGKKSLIPFLQPKLTVGAPDDIYEKEADAMADQVMRMQLPGPINLSAERKHVQRKCDHCEEEKRMQRKESNSSSTTAAPPIVQDVINSSAGKPLDENTRSFMEPRFSYNFSNVKIHNDSKAAESAASINALAYTSGNNVVFNSGQYNVSSDSGKRLLAHELTHVVQQKGGQTIQKQGVPLAEPSIQGWQEKLTGAKAADNCCTVCPDNMGVNSVPGGFLNGIELQAFISNNASGYSFDVKRTKHGKVWKRVAGTWRNLINLGPGNDDDAHNDDECLTPRSRPPYLPYIYSADNPGLQSTSNPINDASATDAILAGNFIEFVRITRANNTTYDDPRTFNWHSMIWVVKDAAGTWSVNPLRSVIGTGHLATLDP